MPLLLPKKLAKAFNKASLPENFWGFVLVKLNAKGRLYRWIAKGINWRSKTFSVATGDQCLFMSRTLFDRVGQYPDQALMEDIEISRRMKRISSPEVFTHKVTVDARRWQKHGAIRTVVKMWATQLAYKMGVSPQRLHDWYYR